MLVKANTNFALDLLRELRSEDPGDNVFFSPLSVSTALAMTLNGARGSTWDAMAHTLGLSGMTQIDINAAYRDLLVSLTGADAGVSLSTANSVWVDSFLQPYVKKIFTGSLSSDYLTELFTRDFGDPSTASDINGWVKDKTSGKIDKLIDTLSPDDVMVLLNAIYFKGDWTIQFDPSKTINEPFKLEGESTATVNMMHAQESDVRLGYYRGDGFQIARLPYGREKIAMYIFLPNENSSLTSMLGTLDQKTFEEALTAAKISNEELALSMPKFKVEYGVKRLNDVLTNMGMGIAFDPNAADLSGIADVSTGKLYLGFVDHKAVVEVNEQGTEAAAVTSVGIKLMGMPTIIPFKVDRPFLFVIRDDRSSSVLFMGAITDPTQAISP